ncbi:hypothetical protein VTK56DRAFT_5288 [Thermocarpiscus australiensis]
MAQEQPCPGGPVLINPQWQSPVFGSLPQELRDKIYGHLFSSTQLTFGLRRTRSYGMALGPNGQYLPERGVEIVTPPKNALAILRTCRRFRFEVGDKWVSQVLFHFEDRATLYTKLAVGPNRVPLAMLAKIRRLRVNYDVPVTNRHLWAASNPDGWYLSDILYSIKHLQLDKLILLGGHGAIDVLHATMHEMVFHGGRFWKELHYISHAAPGFGDDYNVDITNEPWVTRLMFDVLRRIKQAAGRTGADMISRVSYPVATITTYRAVKPCTNCGWGCGDPCVERGPIIGTRGAEIGPEAEPTAEFGYVRDDGVLDDDMHGCSIYIVYKKNFEKAAQGIQPPTVQDYGRFEGPITVFRPPPRQDAD